uniref:Probable Vpr-like protein n=1 Tax=Small ruminant lentivirus TaxID=254355 RepID=A0A142J2Y8_CAEV|nr:tat [Small ruminant lentivirus]
MEQAPIRRPGVRDLEVQGIFEFYEDWETWDRASQRVPFELLQRWLAMLSNNNLRRQVVREAQKWLWQHPKAPVARNCGCRLCNPGWGSEVRTVNM